ncbi:MAG: PfkB family carbohydrate kinase [Armatimonadota bacterium]|nr:PfkB family carbohydrate kinase [Armatimonadota bacterium]
MAYRYPQDVKRPCIVGFGIACLDYLYLAPKAQPGGFAPILDYKVEGGGLTGTALVAASRLGAETIMLGRIGDDDTGEQIVKGLQAEGVDTSNLIRVPGAASYFSIVHVDAETAERTIYGREEKNIDCPTDLIPLDVISQGDILVLDPHWPEGALTVARKARELGIPIVLDSSLKPSHMAVVAASDYAVVSRRAALKFAGTEDCLEAARKLRSFGPHTVVITCGSEGSYYADENEEGYVPAFEVRAVDTTGAGDVFHGAFAFAAAQGWNLRDVIIFASAVAAIKCTKLGGRAGIPDLDQTLLFLKEHGVQLPL